MLGAEKLSGRFQVQPVVSQTQMSLLLLIPLVVGVALARPEVRFEALNATVIGNFEDTSIYGQQRVHGPEVTNDGKAVESFLGIPFAIAPTGDRRFRDAELRSISTNDVINASQWKPGCMAEFGMFTTETSNFSEDCLYVNIWRRTGTRKTDSKPVVVILYGGGYTAGDGHEIDWRGNQLAYFGDVVVVNFNYRLGVFGFLELGIDGAKGNMGHHDQFVALTWIRKHISEFGGDPNRTTLFGVSAGSFSSSYHLLTGDAAGLFHSAIMDAGVLTFFHAESPQQQWDRMTPNFRQLTNCTSGETARQRLDCLKSLPSSKLLELQAVWAVSQTYTFRPTYNSSELTKMPECFIDNDRFRYSVPIIIGDTTNEGLLFVTDRLFEPLPQLRSASQTIEWSRHIMTNHHAQNAPTPNDAIIAEAYGLEKLKTIDEFGNASAQFVGDGLFVCPVMNFAKHFAKSAPTYFYRWNRVRNAPTYPAEEYEGAYHGLMFYTGSGSQYIYLNGSQPQTDKDYIFNTIGMIRDLASDPSATPKFDGRPLVSFDTGKVNHFFNEGFETLEKHPAAEKCQAVWNSLENVCLRNKR